MLNDTNFTTESPNSTSDKRRLRNLRLRLTYASSAVLRGVNILFTLLSVPLLLNYLGEERYGIWITLYSLLSVLAFADLGIGNGLINVIASSYADQDELRARRYVTSALLFLGGLALLLAVVIALLVPFFPWVEVFRVQSALGQQEVGLTSFIFLLCFVLGLPLGAFQRILVGRQKIYLNDIAQIIGKGLSLGAVMLGVQSGVGLPLLVGMLVGIPLLSMGGMAWYVLRVEAPGLRPQRQDVDLGLVQELLKVGGLFFILQLSGAIAFSSNSLVLSTILGTEASTQYNVPAQLFNLVALPIGLLLAPLWPAYAEAFGSGDWQWIRKTFLRSVGYSLVVSTLCVIPLVVIAPTVIRLWTSDTIHPSFDLLLGLGLWQILLNVSNSFAMFLNGVSIIRLQVVIALLMMCCNIVLSVLLTRQIGVSGVVWGSVIPQILIVVVPYLIFFRHYFSKMQSRSQTAAAHFAVNE
jgi:O-antigen/teichoic acid export membrane protein